MSQYVLSSFTFMGYSSSNNKYRNLHFNKHFSELFTVLLEKYPLPSFNSYLYKYSKASLFFYGYKVVLFLLQYDHAK